MAFQKPKGTVDILPGVSKKWQYVEEISRMVMGDYQFHEMRTPIFESYELFSRGVGETSDIVSKEMYDFMDKGDRRLALRPEGTAAIVRAYVENKLFGPEHSNPYKVYYMGPMFRYERPQGGRQRQFHQLGVEVFGSNNPATDVETMALAMDLFHQFGLKEFKLVINSLGDKTSRDAYRAALIAYLEPHFDELSHDSQVRLHKNPLRVLDSKDKKDNEIVKNAPSILDFLNEESSNHFETVKTMLEALEIPFEIDHKMVRGLDYYNHTIFEIMSDADGFGSLTTLCAGGRYNGLVEEIGGPETPGFGFGMGLERLMIALDSENVEIPELNELDVYVVGLGDETNIETLKLVQNIREFGFSAERDYLNRKAKAQFKTAAKLNAKVVLTVGESELENQVVNFKVMKTGKQETVSMKEIYQNFDKVFNLQTTDMTAFNDFFNKED
ncbi:histidine--tRNA ligase [Carnobacterium maltaromaticum]|uniref:Histidine--tRNA ligase n=1 Tax=Carnobacterium maltaromaticum TaxID=2751 RepID=A0AAW9JWI3_CARML|nr:histidine--tRNA ligase [Carnobacterium maltaromaticum]KRN72323.1 histidyl-tRNA synthetase [Carnobacterium maltaromaticum]MBC9808234.1 histidine--tRNA ligase [Carnobacterium maltaromaticum]MCC4310675.1 histidyl-tRNA synthetase [Carnobacterium maltaromaticum]MDZ5758010.1 histidine--tRNA ligase [Carnobacterium maltaromaticum]CAD5898383.1 histidyl-tRNA synthetase [Carnobacterium maltaromaticum]